MVVEPTKLYSQQVPASFKITMASLGPNKEIEATSNGKTQRTSLIFNLDEKEDFTLCSLTNDKVEQQVLDLVLTEGETIAFRVEGPHPIHLSGYYINEQEDDGFINDEEEYSDEAEEDSQIEYDSELEDDDDSEFDSEDDSEFDSEEEKEMTKNPRIRVLESDEEEEATDSEEDEEESEEEESDEEEVKSSKKVKFDLPKTKEPAPATMEAVSSTKDSPKTTKVTPPPAKISTTPAPAPSAPAKPVTPQAKEQGPNPVKKTLPSGLQIEDLKLGSGSKASQGKTVLIHYKGSLLNGKVFDSSFGGKPLKFSVGKGQVIKGMDIGIVGMAVGGSRKLVIPGPLAYGNSALPNIPRNSTLVFEIRLEKIL